MILDIQIELFVLGLRLQTISIRKGQPIGGLLARAVLYLINLVKVIIDKYRWEVRLCVIMKC